MSNAPLWRPRPPAIATASVALVVVALALGPLSTVFESPSFVDRISFVNPTEYHLSIDATDGRRGGWVSVGMAPKASTSVHTETVDQGQVWIFRFSGQGRVAGELRMTRGELEAARWTVRIPERIGVALRAKGALPSP